MISYNIIRGLGYGRVQRCQLINSRESLDLSQVFPTTFWMSNTSNFPLRTIKILNCSMLHVQFLFLYEVGGCMKWSPFRKIKYIFSYKIFLKSCKTHRVPDYLLCIVGVRDMSKYVKPLHWLFRRFTFINEIDWKIC